MIDISAVQYDVILITENGASYTLNEALLDLQWEEQISELAQRATLTVANLKIGSLFLMQIAKINCKIHIYASWGNGGKKLLFDGAIWEWDYLSETQKELTLTAYDNMIKLQQSKDFYYYSAGMTTQGLIGDICGNWGIPLSYQWSQGITHEKKIFNAIPISEMIIGLLEEVRKDTGKKYASYFNDGRLIISDYGTNSTIYKFDSYNTISTSNKLTINGLVTKVKIMGKQDDEGRSAVEKVVDGDTSFGVLQEIIRRGTDMTIESAIAEANTLISTRGKPEEIIRIDAPDLPFMRKGDKIELAAGNLIGFFFVEGVTHKAAARQMSLSLSRA